MSWLERIGFEDVQVTSRSRDGGIDVRGLLTVGGAARVRTAIQVKRWRRNVSGRVVRELRGSLGPQEQGLIITTSSFTKDARSEAERTERAPVALVDGPAFVDLLAQHELGFHRREMTVLEPDEELLAGREPPEEPAVEEGRPVMDGRFRTLWPLPGGARTYGAVAWRLADLARDQPTRGEFLDRLRVAYPQVRSEKTAAGYFRVLVALGFLAVDAGRVALTADGRMLLDTPDNMGILAEALRRRIAGVQEILDELEKGPRDRDQLRRLLEGLGLVWETENQLTFRLNWMESVGLVTKKAGRYMHHRSGEGGAGG